MDLEGLLPRMESSQKEIGKIVYKMVLAPAEKSPEANISANIRKTNFAARASSSTKVANNNILESGHKITKMAKGLS